MRRWWMIFGFLVLLCLVLGSVLAMPEPVSRHGTDHPRVNSMEIGGDASRHDGVIWLGWLYGVVQVALFVTTLTLGLRKRRAGLGSMAAIGVALACMFTAVILVYASNQANASPDLWLGLPPSTAVMLFGVWPLPMSFIVIYVVMFDHWFLAPEDLDRFAVLVRRAKKLD